MRPADRAQDITRIPGEAAALDARPTPDAPRAARHDPLRQRLDNLPPGHPSSPYDTNDTHHHFDSGSFVARPDAVDRRDRSADRSEHFTDAEWHDHVAEVRTRLEDAHISGLATDRLFTVDPDKTRWTRERRHLHHEIVSSFYDETADAPNNHEAIIAGGLAGAGKTTVLGSHAGIDTSKYLTINPDRIKVELAKRDMIPRVEGLSPMEASDLVHEESSYIAKQLASRAQHDGKNIIWDITMSSRESTERRVDELRAAGYKQVKGIFVDLPVDLSVERADSRHRDEENEYRSGNGYGGRYVPPEITASQADPEWGSRNRATFEALKPTFDSWAHFDNGTNGRDPILVGADLDELKERRADD